MDKPKPKPRKPVPRPRTKPKDVEDPASSDPPLDFDSIPDAPNLPQTQGKRGTINIFHLAKKIQDPFSEFDQDFSYHEPPSPPLPLPNQPTRPITNPKSSIPTHLHTKPKSMPIIKHQYDDVAIDEEEHRPNLVQRISNGCSSGRSSLIAEFDPLHCTHSSSEVDAELHRYEYIDSEESCSNNEEDLEDDEKGEGGVAEVAQPPPKLLDLNAAEDVDESSYEPVLPPPTQEPPPPHPPKEESPPSSFLRRLSTKFRLAPIREEQHQCQQQQGATTPTYRDHIIFSTPLYKSGGGLGRRDWVKRRAVLAQGKLTFYNEKQEVSSEYPLHKILLISKKDGGGGGSLYPMELVLLNHRPSSLSLAAGEEGEREAWMSKIIEAHTPALPKLPFQRGGWVYLKEGVAREWSLGWLLLQGRTLIYAYNSNGAEGVDYTELDLRKLRSLELSSKEEGMSCGWVENREVLTLDFISKILYIQTGSVRVSSTWEKALRSASLGGEGASLGGEPRALEDLQLTLDNVPVLVDKCVDFVYAHGSGAEGIYRQSGSSSRIAHLLSLFQGDAWGVVISPKEYSPHDVAGTLKRFFRTLPDPLLSSRLYADWIAASGLGEEEKYNEYLRLLQSLPPINYNILKKLSCHLVGIGEQSDKNLMTILNLSSIWGPTLMNVEGGGGGSYSSACSEAEVIRGLLTACFPLFNVEEEERERERRMASALQSFHSGSLWRKTSGDMKIWVYMWGREEPNTPTLVTVSPLSDAKGILEGLLQPTSNSSMWEVIGGGTLERPLGPNEKIMDIILSWATFPQGDHYLIVKSRSSGATPGGGSLPEQVEVSWCWDGSGKWRRGKLLPRRLLHRHKVIKEWGKGELRGYFGCFAKKSPPTRWTLTLVDGAG